MPPNQNNVIIDKRVSRRLCEIAFLPYFVVKAEHDFVFLDREVCETCVVWMLGSTCRFKQ